MSFYSNTYNHENSPGPITCNPTQGLCERACVQVKKVFDACIKQFSEQNVVLARKVTATAEETTEVKGGSNAFISAKSTTSRGIITNLHIDIVDDCKNLSRVRCAIHIPIEVVYINSMGSESTYKSEIVVDEDVLMCLPETSIIPFQIEAVVSCVCPDGVKHTDYPVTFKVDACITVILKVVVEAELLIPTYGYCAIPPCQEYTQEVCSGFFELPLFPRSPCKTKGGGCNCI